MTLAPIILFVYNRPWHTQQTVKALQKCELAEESDLYIFSDGPKEDASEETRQKIIEVRKYLHSIDGFKSIHIQESPKNKGLANSVIQGVSEVIEKHGKVIVAEDDIVAHQFFLRFMNEALERYEKTRQIFAISATMERFRIPSNYKKDVFLTYRFGSWGWATWRDRWNTINWDINTYPIFTQQTSSQIKNLNRGGNDLWPMLQAQKNGDIDSWAIRMGYNMSIQKRFCLRPVKSFVDNIGMDKSGTHCGDTSVPLLPLYSPQKYSIHLQNNIPIDKKITNNISSIFSPSQKKSIFRRLFDEYNYQKKKIKERRYFSFFLNKYHTKKKKLSNTILVIRIDAIGDSIIWLDQAKEYRKAFSEHRLVLLHNKVWTEIANQLPWFDECIPFDRTKIGDIKYYKQIISILNKYTYEKVFSPVFSRDFITVDWLVHNINAKEKIGYEGDYQNNYGVFAQNLYFRHHSVKYNLKAIADSWYNILVPNDSNCEMELQRNAHFIRQTIDKDFRSRLPLIPFNIPKYKDLPSEEYAVLFLGASTECKTWPVNNFIEITHHIPYKTIVFCGSQQEQPLAKEFISSYNGNNIIIDFTGKTTLLNLISIISNAKIVISNDTSASHIAVATRAPSICLLGGGHYGRFHPYQADIIDDDEKKSLPTVVTSTDKSCFKCNFRCKYPLQNGRWKCIDDIPVEDVVATIKRENCVSVDANLPKKNDTYK